jgi:Protein of unknown function (DUF4058)
MPSPFPGMDPYLERPGLWRDLNHSLISTIQGLLAAQLRPTYVVRIDERVYIVEECHGASKLQLSDRFEHEVREAFLKIIDRETREVRTVIEVLRPTSKAMGSPGLKNLKLHRDDVMGSSSHWVEIDLFRGDRTVDVPTSVGPHEYFVHVSKRDMRPQAMLYPIRLWQRLPIIPIPVRTGDPDASLDLQAALDAIYDRAGYDLDIDYRREPNPPLSADFAVWADQLLRAKGIRS